MPNEIWDFDLDEELLPENTVVNTTSEFIENMELDKDFDVPEIKSYADDEVLFGDILSNTIVVEKKQKAIKKIDIDEELSNRYGNNNPVALRDAVLHTVRILNSERSAFKNTKNIEYSNIRSSSETNDFILKIVRKYNEDVKIAHNVEVFSHWIRGNATIEMFCGMDDYTFYAINTLRDTFQKILDNLGKWDSNMIEQFIQIYRDEYERSEIVRRETAHDIPNHLVKILNEVSENITPKKADAYNSKIPFEACYIEPEVLEKFSIARSIHNKLGSDVLELKCCNSLVEFSYSIIVLQGITKSGLPNHYRVIRCNVCPECGRFVILNHMMFEYLAYALNEGLEIIEEKNNQKEYKLSVQELEFIGSRLKENSSANPYMHAMIEVGHRTLGEIGDFERNSLIQKYNKHLTNLTKRIALNIVDRGLICRNILFLNGYHYGTEQLVAYIFGFIKNQYPNLLAESEKEFRDFAVERFYNGAKRVFELLENPSIVKYIINMPDSPVKAISNDIDKKYLKDNYEVEIKEYESYLNMEPNIEYNTLRKLVYDSLNSISIYKIQTHIDDNILDEIYKTRLGKTICKILGEQTDRDMIPNIYISEDEVAALIYEFYEKLLLELISTSDKMPILPMPLAKPKVIVNKVLVRTKVKLNIFDRIQRDKMLSDIVREINLDKMIDVDKFSKYIFGGKIYLPEYLNEEEEILTLYDTWEELQEDFLRYKELTAEESICDTSTKEVMIILSTLLEYINDPWKQASYFYGMKNLMEGLI